MFPNKECRCSKGIPGIGGYENKGVMPSSLPDYGTSMSLFTNKKAAFFITGPWEYANLKKALVTKWALWSYRVVSHS